MPLWIAPHALSRALLVLLLILLTSSPSTTTRTMCVIFYALDPHSNPEYSLVIASNRDEFLSRPTLPASWHSFDSPSSSSSPHILSARDATGGGTWLGITRTGAFATLTNFTEVSAPLPAGMDAFESRGRLVRDWLVLNADEGKRKGLEETRSEIERYLLGVRARLDRYPGFNLLIGAVSTQASLVGYITNRHPDATLAPDATPHIFTASSTSPTGLSNSTLSHPWTKVVSGSQVFNSILSHPSTEQETIERLFDLLWTSSCPKPTQRSELRNSVLISPLQLPAAAAAEGKDWYATRTSTVILVRKDGSAKLVERDTFRRERGEAVLVNGPRGSGALEGRDGGQRVFEWRLD